MVLPLKSQFTIFSAISVSETARVPPLGTEHPEHANSLLLEVVGASTPSWTLDIQGRLHPDGTYTNVDYVQVWQAGSAALANAQLTVSDTTVRFYLVPNCPPFMRLIATATTGTLTVHGAYTSEVFVGTHGITGDVAHDAADAGNPVKVGLKATTDFSGESAVAGDDRVNAAGTARGAQIVAGAAPINSDSIGNYTSFPSEADAELPVATGLYGWAPDGASDKLRTLGNTAGAGLGVLAAAPWIPGASDIKTTSGVVNNSTTRTTLLTPTSGKKVRIVGALINWINATAMYAELYFGTGATYATDVTKAIAIAQMDLTDQPNFYMPAPDGGGPVGAVDDVVSMRAESAVATDLRFTIYYREE